MKDEHLRPRRECGAMASTIGYMFDVTDRIRHPYFCTTCEYRSTMYVPYSIGGAKWRPLARGSAYQRGEKPSGDLFAAGGGQ